MDAKECMELLARSFKASRDSIDRDYSRHNRGLYAGWNGAMEAVERELRYLDACEATISIQEQYRKATEPYSSTLRIDATPEELAKRQRMIDNGEVPF